MVSRAEDREARRNSSLGQRRCLVRVRQMALSGRLDSGGQIALLEFRVFQQNRPTAASRHLDVNDRNAAIAVGSGRALNSRSWTHTCHSIGRVLASRAAGMRWATDVRRQHGAARRRRSDQRLLSLAANWRCRPETAVDDRPVSEHLTSAENYPVFCNFASAASTAFLNSKPRRCASWFNDLVARTNSASE